MFFKFTHQPHVCMIFTDFDFVVFEKFYYKIMKKLP